MRAARPGFVSFFVDGLSVEAGIERQGDVYTVHLPERTLQVSLAEGPSAREGPTAAAAGPLRVEAPMPGRVVRLLVEEGQEVAAGQGLLVMEAMKMENELRAPRASRVAAVRVRAPCAVETGALLVVLE
jgi:biotin carboxyl carrier protein